MIKSTSERVLAQKTFRKESNFMRTDFDQYVIEHKLDTRTIFQEAGVRYAVVYYALRGEPILPESAEKIKQAVFRMTGVPYSGSFVLLQSAEPLPVPQRRKQ